MILPFAYSKLNMSWLRWQAAHAVRGLSGITRRNAERFGLAAPPKIVSIPDPQPMVVEVSDGCSVSLQLAGQNHQVWSANSPANAHWRPGTTSSYWMAHAHSLVWLAQSVDKTAWSRAVMLFYDWLQQNVHASALRSPTIVHAPDVIGQRMVAVLRVLAVLPFARDIELYRALRRLVVADANFLSTAGFGGAENWSRLSVLEGQCLFAGSFDGLQAWHTRLLPMVADEIDAQWSDTGVHGSADVGVSLASLVSIKNCYLGLSRLKSPDKNQQQMLTRISDRIKAAKQILAVLLADKSEDDENRLPAFSGFSLPSPANYRTVLETIAPGLAGKHNVIDAPWTRISHHFGSKTDYQAMSVAAYNRVPAFLNAGRSTAYHAGLAAIEVASELGPLVGGCGIGRDISAWGDRFRSTLAFSTLSLFGFDALPVTPQPSNQLPANFSDGSAELAESQIAGTSIIELRHNLFEVNGHRATVFRRLRLSEDGKRLSGEDLIEVANIDAMVESLPTSSIEKQGQLRFQVAPNIAVQHCSPTHLLFEQKCREGIPHLWDLVLTSGSVAVEQGLWFDDQGQAIVAPNVAVQAAIHNGRCLIFWRLERRSNEPSGVTSI